MKPIIAISMGDYNGIGPEVTLKALARIETQYSTPVWIGSKYVLRYYSDSLNLPFTFHEVDKTGSFKDGVCNLFDPFPDEELYPEAGVISAVAGMAAMRALETAIRLCMNNRYQALVTAPISKEAISLAGYNVPGHTEFLAQQTSASDVVMMLVNEKLRVALVSTHLPLKEVVNEISTDKIVNKAGILHESLIRDFGIQSPKIAVLGLNPHAGDGGVLGMEEIEIIRPAIQSLREKGIKADGPFPADGFFGSRLNNAYDAILAMYHDQGLIPFKTLSFGKGVNFTAGLPIIRTSPDHGTAFSIAGKNKADEKSFLEAYKLAVTMAEKRISIYKA
jgi:4-hydroxythreonine-4-phosphate dehydrogenase